VVVGTVNAVGTGVVYLADGIKKVAKGTKNIVIGVGEKIGNYLPTTHTHTARKLSLYDFLGFSSSAWAEVGDKTHGVMSKPPDIIGMNIEGDSYVPPEGKKIQEMQFCDPGARCNLPLSAYIHAAQERVVKMILFDFSDTEKCGLSMEMEKCMRYWSDMGFKPLHSESVGDPALGVLKFRIMLHGVHTKGGSEVTSGSAPKPIPGEAVDVIWIPFKGQTKDHKLIYEFPTSVGKLGTGIKSYTCPELVGLENDYRGYLEKVFSEPEFRAELDLPSKEIEEADDFLFLEQNKQDRLGLDKK